MEFQPVHDRILIKPTPPDKFRGAIELLDSETEPKSEGTVIAVGDGVPLHNIKLNVTGEVTKEAMEALERVVDKIEKGRQMRVQPGQYVLYGRYAGTKVRLNDEDYIIIREADVFGFYKDSQ